MADEREIILKLEIDAEKSITNLVSVKDRIKALKEEQKGLNTETVEGKKTYEAYQGQIKALTKEQRSLENAVSQTAGAMEFEAGSIAANRAELSKLTAEYKNIAKPTAEQTKKIKDLSDRLKEQESAIGNNTRNVGNYKDALNGAAQGIGVFSPQLGQLTNSFNGVTGGVKTAAKGFGTLKGAIASTGIGLLVLAFASLISYFKSSDDGATKLDATMSALGSVMKTITGYLAQIGDIIFGLVDGTRSFSDVLNDLGDIILNNVINRFKSFLVLGEAIGELFKGNYANASKLALDATIQFTTGVTNATDKAKAFADEIARAAKESYEYEVALDSLNDRQRDLNVTNAKNNTIVQQLIIQSKNKTLSDQERIDKLILANKIEEESARKQLALDNERLALLQKRNEREANYINSKLKRDLEAAKSDEERANIEKRFLTINDSLKQDVADLETKIANDRTAFLLLTETNENKIAKLREESAIEAAKIAKEQEEARQKELEQLAALANAEQQLDLARIKNKERLLELELQSSDTSSKRRLEILQEQLSLEIQYEQLATQIKLSNEKLFESERIAIVEDSLLTEEEIKAKFREKENKIKEEEKKKEDAQQKEYFDNLKKQRDEWLAVTNQAIGAASQAVALKLQNDLDNIESARNEELRRFGKTQADRDKINAKYDKQEKKRRDEAAKADLTIKQISAVINTAVGVTQALAQGGIAGIALGAIVAAAGAIEIAAIQGQKSKLAKGGLIPIGGNLHSAGGTTFRGTDGTVFEAERGEVLAVVNRHDAPKLNYLSSINSVHGTPFYNRPAKQRNYFADGGLVARSNGNAVQESILQRSATIEAVSKLPNPIVLVKDIDSGQGRNVLVKDRANI